MDVNEKEKLYHNIERDTLEFSKSLVMEDAAKLAMDSNFENRTVHEKADFANYLGFAHGSSIKTAYQKNLGKMAEADYEILKHCKEFAQSVRTASVKTTKAEAKYSRKVDLAKMHAEELLEELNK